MVSRNQIDVGLSGSSGTGSFVGSSSATLTSPTMVTPALGTPASGNLTNCTGIYWGSQSGTNLTLQFASGTLSAANIQSLHATPIQMVAAPGANKIISVMYATFHYIYNAPAYTAAAAQLIRCQYDPSVSSTAIFSTVVANSVLIGTNNSLAFGPGLQNSNITDASSLNVGLYLYQTVATEVTTGAGTLNWYVWYSIIDTTI